MLRVLSSTGRPKEDLHPMSKPVIPVVSAAPGPRDPAPVTRPVAGPLADARGRGLRDLRISVTDRCNFRCTYCMPREVFDASYEFLPHAELLTFEEIVRVARVFHGLGIAKIRLTGGEPLLRRGIEDLVAMLSRGAAGRGPHPHDQRLRPQGRRRARSTPRGCGASPCRLDSLDDATFRAMNDVDFPVAKVLEAIDAAAAEGLAPVKVNMVVKRGTNDHQVVDMARHFRGTGHIVRFIEFMDVGATNGWRMDDVVPSAEVVRRIDEAFPLRAREPEPLRRGRQALALQGRQRRVRHHLQRDAGLLLVVHPRAALHRRLALHLPLRQRAATT